MNVDVALEEPFAVGTAALLFKVRDTGIGIAREKQQLIFEAFRQEDGSTTGEIERAAAAHFAIHVNRPPIISTRRELIARPSPRKYGGTARFGIASAATGAKPSYSASLMNMLDASKGGDGPAVSPHILLAEDNPANQRLAMRLLESGHRVDLAASGREAIDCLEKGHFDLVLMDLQMPDMDGIEATALIREPEKRHGGRTPIVALTAHTMKGDRERCLAGGMDNYINKPIDAVKFLEIVELTAASPSREFIPTLTHGVIPPDVSPGIEARFF